MTVKKLTLAIIILLTMTGIIYQVTSTAFTGPDYIKEPIQEDIYPSETITIQGSEGSVELKLLATYSISAVVKSTMDYSTDFTSQISPRDFALAWADINDPAIDKHVSYSQKNRWYYFTVSGKSPVDITYVDLHSANTHLIPKDEAVRLKLNLVKSGDFISMEGYLVNATFDNGFWNSSTSRSDTGDGSCEIMYVTDIVIHE